MFSLRFFFSSFFTVSPRKRYFSSFSGSLSRPVWVTRNDARWPGRGGAQTRAAGKVISCALWVNAQLLLFLMSAAHNSSDHRCHDTVDVESSWRPVTSAVMFSTGVLGNVLALVLLRLRRGKTVPSMYPVLVTALLMTDLLGTISVSPVVLSAYARGQTLLGMSAGGEVCDYFGFSMTFLSLSTLAILCVMALERYLSIGHPYFYERHLSQRRGYVIIALIYLCSVVFCVGPFMGLGKYAQYCPGTWCFLDMDGKHKVYIGFYASFIFIMTSSTVVCNISVIAHLVMMCKRRKMRGACAPSRRRRSLSMTEEVEHLLPLAIITVVFICCTFPLVLRVYMNLAGVKERHAADLGALRLLSFHSIINPWVFIILRPSALKVAWRKLRRPQAWTFIWGKSPGAQGPPGREEDGPGQAAT